jgi:hypothetical protein
MAVVVVEEVELLSPFVQVVVVPVPQVLELWVVLPRSREVLPVPQ